MSKFFMDLEFLEGTQNKTFLGMNVGKTKPTIDLISIGIVSDEVKYIGGVDPISKDEKVQVNTYSVSREYYAISKDFNLKEAWNRFDIKYDHNLFGGKPHKVYWLRENVLKPIFKELAEKDNNTYFDFCNYTTEDCGFNLIVNYKKFTYHNLKKLINKYGKINKQIAEEIKVFIANRGDNKTHKDVLENEYLRNKPEFYAYYADYDWVVFCWLFGKMIDLPKGFPMYCIDLKQELERLNETLGYNCDVKGKSYRLQEKPNYPKQTNEHNALADSRFVKDLYYFLKSL